MTDTPGMSMDAEARKEEAMTRVAANASERWFSLAEIIVVRVARRQRFLTSEDVRDEMRRQHPNVFTHEMRALGPVMKNAAKNGVIEKDHFDFYGAASRHRAPCQVWHSLCYTP